MRSISPIIATILLIVMVVAIAGLIYAFITGMFNGLTSSTSSQANKLSNVIAFSLNNIYCSNNQLYFVLYNNGNIPIDIENSIIAINENGNTLLINNKNVLCENNIISPNSQELCSISNVTCVYDPNIINNPQIIITYQGVSNNQYLGNGYEILSGNINIISSYSTTTNTTTNNNSSSTTTQSNTTNVTLTNTTTISTTNTTSNSSIIQYSIQSYPTIIPIVLYNTQNSATPSPFQQDIAICNYSGESIQNPYFEILGYNSTSGTTNASITLPSNASIYLCNGGDGNGQLSSVSWNVQEEDYYQYTSLGYQHLDNCSDSSEKSDIVVGGIAINTNEYDHFRGNYYYDANSFSYEYTVYNESNVVISIACGYFDCNYIQLPSGCQTLINTTGSDNSETSFFAVCYNESPGTYSVNVSLTHYGYASIGVYEFNNLSSSVPYSPTPTSNGIEMLNGYYNEQTYILPPNNGKIPLIPLIVEEGADPFYYELGTDLFGNTSDQISTSDLSAPVSNYSTYAYYYGPSSIGSAYINSTLASGYFSQLFTPTYYYLIINDSYAQAGSYNSNSNNFISLSSLDTYTDYQNGYIYSYLNYTPTFYPTLEISTGTKGNNYYNAYVEWVVARAYPPNGVMPSIYIS